MLKAPSLCFAISFASILATSAAHADPYAQGTGGAPLGITAPSPHTPQAEASVDLSTGAATAAYVFDLPKARGEAQPGLSLRYNSSTGVGFAGVGWTLSMPSIVRKGVAGVPQFVDDVLQNPGTFSTNMNADEYYVDGQLLVPICAVDSCTGALQGEIFPSQVQGGGWVYFRRQLDDGNRYFLSADGLTWEMQAKSGRVLTFGHPLDGAFNDGIEQPDAMTAAQVGGSLAAVYRWNLVRDTDASGNTVYYVWTDLSAQITDPSWQPMGRQTTVQYLSDIYDTSALYGSTPGRCDGSPTAVICTPPVPGPAPFAHHIRLNWNISAQALPGASATSLVPYLTSPIWQAVSFAELTGVDVTSAVMHGTSRAMVRRYHLAYQWNTAQTRRFLHSVTLEGQCGPGAVTEDPYWGTLPTPTNCPAMPPTTYGYSDDPAPDAPLQTLPSAMAGAPTPAGQGYTFVDLNGDGTADFLTGFFQGNAAQLVAYYSGDPNPHPLALSSQTPPSLPGGLVTLIPNYYFDSQLVMGDWVADGRTNWLWVDQQSLSASLYTSDKTPNIVGSQGPLLPTFPNVPSWGDATFDGLRGRSVDLDGDGLTDVFQVADLSAPDPTTTRAYLTIRDRAGQTSPFALQTATVCPTPDMDPTTYPKGAVDLNGKPFAPSFRALADFDGDGLSDLVIVTLPNAPAPYFIQTDTPTTAGFGILTNRGDGRFGGPVSDPQYTGCARSAGAAYRWVFPLGKYSAYNVGDYAAQLQQTSIQAGTGIAGYNTVWAPMLGDVNGDGLADYVALTGAGMDVCLRQGASADSAMWACQTTTYNGCGGSSSPPLTGTAYCSVGFAHQFCDIALGCLPGEADIDPSELHGSLADVNGDGILDIVTEEPAGGTGSTFARTLVSGTKPGLLQSIASSTGATTAISYQTARSLGFAIPSPTWVVTEIDTTNGLAGAQGLTVQQAYTYNVPVYDGREKQFYGFQKVTQTRAASGLGDPGHQTTTTFATDACGNSVDCEAPLQDYAYFHALRALPVTVEDMDASGAHLRTTWNEYQWNWNYTGLDNRHVIDRWVTLKHVFLWDAGGGTTTSVPVTTGGTLAVGVAVPNVSVALPTSGSELRTETDHDAFGNVNATVDFGKVGQDTPIRKTFAWQLPLGDATGWNYRLVDEKLSYADSTGTQATGRVREYQASYDSPGRLFSVSGYLADTLPLPTRAAQQPQTQSGNNTWVTFISAIYYDGYGNPLQVYEANDRCTGAQYDPDYGQLAIGSAQYPSGCEGPEHVATNDYDRGLGLLTSTMLPGGIISYAIDYDAFGRPTTIYQPDSSMFGYRVPAESRVYSDTGPLRTVHSWTVGDDGSLSVEHYRFLDAFGDDVANLDATGSPLVASGGTQHWIASGVHTRFPSGRVQKAYKPSFFDGAAVPPPFNQAMSAAFQTFMFDGLGRPLQTTDYRGGLTSFSYSAAQLSVTTKDAEQQQGGLHAGSSSTVRVDGHGRTVQTIAQLTDGPQGPGSLTTTTTYQATGEPTWIVQTAPSNVYARALYYDSLGRRTQSSEPNSGYFTYAYDDSGEVVGTADARGCGENIVYDSLGRVVSEDYSPCAGSVPSDYTAPQANGDGTETYTVYDPIFQWVTETYDRAQHTFYYYDARGRPTSLLRQIAVPGGDSSLAARYAPNVYAKTLTYFESNRLASETTGADVWELNGNGSEVDMIYGYDGLLRALHSSYGPLITGQTIDPSGAVLHRTFGDAAATTADMNYDGNEQLSGYYLHRTAGPWVSSQPGYSPSDPTTLAGDLTELSISRDQVGNPTAMLNIINNAPWPSGALPQSRTFKYYADYRLKEVDASYSGGDDPFLWPPFKAEAASGSAKFPQPMTTPANRVRKQSFGYDWLGNMVSSMDDSNAFLERSLGTIQNAGGGHQIQSATSADGQHSLNVQYDAAGNVTSWSVLQQGTTISTYGYKWDEVGRLAEASRRDAGTSSGVTEDFTYDGSGQRVLTTYGTPANVVVDQAPSYRVEVFPSLVLENATFPDAGGDYDHTAATEHLYLGGVAHVFQGQSLLPNVDDPNASNNPVRVFLTLTEPDGSTGFVVDSSTGEIVERPTYMAYGAAESDFRPTRWGSFREDVRFTGHRDDAEVGLVYHGARYYAPQLGRWISPDPLPVHAMRGDSNVYAYVRGSPIRYVDPFGLDGGDPVAPDPGDGAKGSDGTGLFVPGCDGYCGGLAAGDPQGDGFGIRQVSAGVAGGGGGGPSGGNGDGSSMADFDTSVPQDLPPFGAMGEAEASRFASQFGEITNVQAVVLVTQQGDLPPAFVYSFADPFGSRPSTGELVSRLYGYSGTGRAQRFDTFMQAVGIGGVIALNPEGLPLRLGGAEGAGAVASNAANAPRLAMQLATQEAESAFTATGELSQEAIQGARQIIPPGQLGNPAIPQGFGKFSTGTFQSPSGPFQVHFYMNPSTGETFYGLDFKAIFNGERGPTYFQPFSGSAP